MSEKIIIFIIAIIALVIYALFPNISPGIGKYGFILCYCISVICFVFSLTLNKENFSKSKMKTSSVFNNLSIEKALKKFKFHLRLMAVFFLYLGLDSQGIL
jgi:hypothetical protein